MIQLIAESVQMPGEIAIYRFAGDKIYLKYTNIQQSKQIIDKLQKDGCKVFIGRNGWIQVTLPKDEEYQLGKIKISVKDMDYDELNEKLSNFIEETLIAGNFIVKREEV